MERNGIEYDPMTNLPKLREGLLWKIGTTSSRGYLTISIEHEVQLYKELMGVKYGKHTELRTYEGLYRHLRTDDLSNEAIRAKADELYTELDTLTVNKARMDSLVGLYPPKSL